jgi:hypothetical protein
MSGYLAQSQGQEQQAQPPMAPPEQGEPQQTMAQEGQEPAAEEKGESGDQATPEEQKAYENALAACSEIVHTNDDSHQAVMKMLDAREKIGSLAKAAVMVVTQVDAKINMPESVLAGVLAQVVDWMLELATAGKQMQFSETEEKQVLTTATDLLMETYGHDRDSYDALIGGESEKSMKGYHEEYAGLLK